ncbi:BrnA antitoxin family protein [Devosia salina]|uniref:BrnA antitoxin family protein n=2 Tax=Devosia salina TaxID=2860336 RepID=A0ABX8WLC0_9HYPH|nr:BrnA antitoxin family protein [Devosia salina]
MKRATLAEIRLMKDRGELYHNPNAPEGPELGEEFWKNAVWVEPKGTTSVHLKLDSEVFEFFKRQGKGHLTRMQNVLKAYVKAHQGATPENEDGKKSSRRAS